MAQKPPDQLIDTFTSQGIMRGKAYAKELHKYHLNFYDCLASQRAAVIDRIKESLTGAARGPHRIRNWQRVITYAYSNNPLSVKGSVLSIGGRFNIGDINPAKFSEFAALYAAKDKPTALMEALSQSIALGKESEALDHALLTPQSVSNISLKGELSSIIDLNKPRLLKGFVDIIKEMKIPQALVKTAMKLGQPTPTAIDSITVLINTLLDEGWRHWPMQYCVPYPSQIFGELVSNCGIDAIIYPSKFSSVPCASIYFQNFTDQSGSYLELSDKAPDEVAVLRMDAQVWAATMDDLA